MRGHCSNRPCGEFKICNINLDINTTEEINIKITTRQWLESAIALQRSIDYILNITSHDRSSSPWCPIRFLSATNFEPTCVRQRHIIHIFLQSYKHHKRNGIAYSLRALSFWFFSITRTSSQIGRPGLSSLQWLAGLPPFC